jgi:hypothetical protein
VRREYSAKAKRKYRAKRNQRLKQTYGITTQQWDKLYDLQGGVCPICIAPLRKPGNKDGKRASSVDHDHKSGRVRGLLCHRCNKYKVGNNNLATAQRMVEYLVSDVDGRLL